MNCLPRLAAVILLALSWFSALVAQHIQPRVPGDNMDARIGARMRPSINRGLKPGSASSSPSISPMTGGPRSLDKNGVASSRSSTATLLRTTDGDTWQSYPIYGGEMTSIVVDPASAQIIYAGTRDAGVFKSTDGGLIWLPARTGLSVYPIRSLAIDPKHPSILYAGTDNDGTWKSTDAGNSWFTASAGLQGLDESHMVLNIVVDGTNTDTLFEGLAGGGGLGAGNIYRSVNGAAAWMLKDSLIPRNIGTGIYTEGITALALGPSSSGLVYAGTTADGAFRSIDEGETWQDMNNGIAGSLGSRETVKAIAADPHHAGRPSAIIGSDYYVCDTLNWKKISGTNSSYIITNTFFDHIHFHPASSSIVYDAGEGFNKSTDGGITWSHPLPSYYTVPDIAFNASSPGTIYAASQPMVTANFLGGVFKSTDEGQTWSSTDTGITATTIQALAVDPQNPNRIYAGDGNGFFFRTQDGGATWITSHPYEDVHFIAVDPLSPGSVYIATGPALYHSTDHGVSFSAVHSASDVACIAILSDSIGTIYLGGDYYGVGIQKSTDGGTTWVQKNSGIPPLYGDIAPINSLTPDPLVHGTVWATTQTDSGGGILKTIDGGEHWNLTKVTNAFDVTAMAFKPGDPNIILTDGYFGFTDRINKTTDGGKTWQVKLPDVVATSFVFDPRNPNVVYASTEGSGIIRSTDCGETWEDYSAGIYYPVHYALAHYDNGSDLLLLTGSYGSGLYWIKPSLVVSGVAAESQATIPKEPHLDPCYPNPFNPTTTIHYDLPQRSHVTLEVYNTLGQKVAELVNAEKMAGSYHVTFNANGLASGVYLYRIQAGSFVETKKLVLLR